MELRSGPGTEYPVLRQLAHDTEVVEKAAPNAQGFVSAGHKATGVWPGLYGGSCVRELFGDSQDPVLGQCWFWLAEYGPDARVPPTWKDWTLWQ